MTMPPEPPRKITPWYLQPAIVLPSIAALVTMTALLAPEQVVGRNGDGRLSTFSTSPMGARIVHDLARRLGWHVVQRKGAVPPAGNDVIHAVLDPSMPLRMTEAHELLERVRGGAALFVVLGGGTDALEDSLHVTYADTGGFHLSPAIGGAEHCEPLLRSFRTLWADNRVRLYHIRFRGPQPDSTVTFLRLDSIGRHPDRTRAYWGAVGFPYGRGRVVVGSDPDMLRNDAIRVCGFDLDAPAVRMLEYLRDGGDTLRTRLVFDEYHHGYGPQPGTLHAAATYLGDTPSGHLFVQVVAAGLVLLLAMTPRAIPPCDPDRIERRSPLEHVDALARAYAQVGATRTATGRLVRGIRRRVERGNVNGRSGLTDAAYLERAAQFAPSLTADVVLIQRALDAPVPRKEFAAVGAALERLESSLTRI